MSETLDIQETAEALRVQMQDQLGIRGKTYVRALKRARRRLPRRIRNHAEFIRSAQALGGHPKLERRIDPTTFRDAARAFSDHLDTINAHEERRTRRLRLLALIVLQVLIVAACFAGWMRWRGYF